MKEQRGGSQVRYSGAVTLLSKATWADPLLQREWVIISCLHAVLSPYVATSGWVEVLQLAGHQSPESVPAYMFAQVKHHLLCHVTEGCNRVRAWEATGKQPQIFLTCVCRQTQHLRHDRTYSIATGPFGIKQRMEWRAVLFFWHLLKHRLHSLQTHVELFHSNYSQIAEKHLLETYNNVSSLIL